MVTLLLMNHRILFAAFAAIAPSWLVCNLLQSYFPAFSLQCILVYGLLLPRCRTWHFCLLNLISFQPACFSRVFWGPSGWQWDPLVYQLLHLVSAPVLINPSAVWSFPFFFFFSPSTFWQLLLLHWTSGSVKLINFRTSADRQVKTYLMNVTKSAALIKSVLEDTNHLHLCKNRSCCLI